MLRHHRKSTRGFTLVELATVVVVVGILAVISVVFYRRYLRTAHLAEATNMTKSIRAAQEAYKAEKGVYYDASQATNNFYPAATPGRFTTEWGGPCTTCVDPLAWKHLAVDVKGPVMFGYATVAGNGASISKGTPPMAPNFAAVSPPPAIGATDPFYTTVAWGDPDGDGNPTMVYGYSQSGQLIITGD